MAANYYDVLDVSKDADGKAISDAYKKMALKWHPDKNPVNADEANERFKRISEAYQVLSDSTKRLRYDRGENVNNDDSYDSDDEEFESFFHFLSPEMLFRHFFQQYEARAFSFFGAHDFDHDRRHRSGQRNKKPEQSRRTEKCCENRGKESCHVRTVNGKQWMTKTSYEDGNEIVTRYEDGELISKQINGISQKI